MCPVITTAYLWIEGFVDQKGWTLNKRGSWLSESRVWAYRVGRVEDSTVNGCDSQQIRASPPPLPLHQQSLLPCPPLAGPEKKRKRQKKKERKQAHPSADYIQCTLTYQEREEGEVRHGVGVKRQGVLPGPTFRQRGYQREKERETKRKFTTVVLSGRALN